MKRRPTDLIDLAHLAKYRDNPGAIADYLNDALTTGDPVAVTKAIGVMARAQGMSAIARKAGVNREGLYKVFGGASSPAFDKVITVLLALDIRLNFKPSGSRRAAKAALKVKK